MISKELFIETAEKLKEFDDKEQKLRQALDEYSGNYNMFWSPLMPDLVVKVLEEIFEDTQTHWVDYFINDCDYLKNDFKNSISLKGKPYRIDTWADVYDFLIGNIKEKNEL